ncbi:NERD domain-containing protein [Quadrisphaera sp. INWT6]|uniref:NERD domain-containing protein n=1 Tax=Quadrisphaera sp. INWT6 TaxID=2596917 RepID=UPI0018920836|nr:NERD domain-containing protein [Quadrisphaera sp. INWT6]
MTAAATVRRRAGHEAMAEALRHQASAPARSPLAERVSRLTGSDPLDPGARSAYSAALGARAVGRHLARLSTGLHVGAGHDRWHVLHSLPLPDPSGSPGEPPRVLDHVVVGPGGVVVVSAQHLPGARVRVSRGALVADGQRRPALTRAADDARLLNQHLTLQLSGQPGQHLDVPVVGAVAVVGAERLSAGRPSAVAVLSAARLVRWLQRRPRALTPDAVDAVAAHLRLLATSQPPSPHDTPGQTHVQTSSQTPSQTPARPPSSSSTASTPGSARPTASAAPGRCWQRWRRRPASSSPCST